MEKVLVIGGANIDYIGKSNQKIIFEDSNIGSINISFGGVGRNIVENLARLGSKVTFISAIGDDFLGKAMIDELKSLNVELIIPTSKGKTTGGYLAIHDDKGKMEVALCSQEITENITKEFLESLENVISSFKYIVIDTNFSFEILKYLTNKYQDKTIFLDAISTKKGEKIIGLESNISYLKCNELEAKSLFGINYFNKFSNNTLIVTKGKDSIEYNLKEKICYSNVNEVKEDEIVNATGAGDAFFSGFIFGITNDYDIVDAIEIGKKMSYYTLKSNGAVNKNIKIEDILN